MLVDIYNQQGEKTGQVRLPKEIFEVRINPDLIHQVVVSLMSNQRQRIAHTKDRGEVRGGGKKPGFRKEQVEQEPGVFVRPYGKEGGSHLVPEKRKFLKK